jgi:hypothetical protein
MKKVSSKLKFSTTFHPRTNDEIEKVNGIINQYLYNYVVGDHKD